MRIDALQDFAQLGLHLIRCCSLHAPALPPGGEQQRLTGVGIAISRQDQRCTSSEAAADGVQKLAFGLVSGLVMKNPEQRGGIELTVRRKFMDLAKMEVSPPRRPFLCLSLDGDVHHRL